MRVVPGAGRTNALGLNHWFGLPTTTGPLNAGFRDGRSGFRVSPSPERFEPIWGVNGKPLNNVAIPSSCHPPMSASWIRLRPADQRLSRPDRKSTRLNSSHLGHASGGFLLEKNIAVSC